MNLTCSRYGLVLRDMTSFRTNNQACAIASAVLSLPTLVLNLSMMSVLLSKRYRSKPCEMFLLNLATTDLLTGLLNMPSNFFVFRFMSQTKDPCRFAKFTIPIGYTLGIASFLTLVAVAVERYMSIFHPYLHGARLRMSNVVITIALIWALSVAMIIPNIFLPQGDVLRVAIFCIGLVGTLINTICYLKILCFARKVRLEIAATTARYGGPGGSMKERGERSLFKIGGLIILTVGFCYAPVVSNAFLRLMEYDSVALDFAFCWGWVLANASSLIDPIVTCSFNPDIRHSLLNLWRVRICHRREVGREGTESAKHTE